MAIKKGRGVVRRVGSIRLRVTSERATNRLRQRMTSRPARPAASRRRTQANLGGWQHRRTLTTRPRTASPADHTSIDVMAGCLAGGGWDEARAARLGGIARRHRSAKTASEQIRVGRMRSGSSPARINISVTLPWAAPGSERRPSSMRQRRHHASCSRRRGAASTVCEGTQGRSGRGSHGSRSRA